MYITFYVGNFILHSSMVNGHLCSKKMTSILNLNCVSVFSRKYTCKCTDSVGFVELPKQLRASLNYSKSILPYCICGWPKSFYMRSLRYWNCLKILNCRTSKNKYNSLKSALNKVRLLPFSGYLYYEYYMNIHEKWIKNPVY